MKTRWTRSFTLIELMTVVAVIAVLAGLVLGGAGAVRQRAARSQAKVEVGALEAALARYQMDMGAYPLAVQINPTGNAYPANPTTYAGASTILFTNLWGSATYTAAPLRKRFLDAKASMVNTNGANYFMDPYGNSYGYYWNGNNSLFGGAVPDVWSTGGANNAAGIPKWITSW